MEPNYYIIEAGRGSGRAGRAGLGRNDDCSYRLATYFTTFFSTDIADRTNEEGSQSMGNDQNLHKLPTAPLQCDDARRRVVPVIPFRVRVCGLWWKFSASWSVIVEAVVHDAIFKGLRSQCRMQGQGVITSNSECSTATAHAGYTDRSFGVALDFQGVITC